MSERIPVISLWQPWASLIFTGDKLHETRAYPFPAKYAGQRIAIHAAQQMPRQITVGLHMLCEMNWGAGEAWRRTLPRGAILGTVRLLHAYPTDDMLAKPGRIDRICGDWGEGRYAWLLDAPEVLDLPLPAKGKQGWWSIEQDALARIEAGTDATTKIGAAEGESWEKLQNTPLRNQQ